MRVLIIGCGFIGKHLAVVLREKGCHISIFDKEVSELNIKCDWYQGDLRDKTAVTNCINTVNPEMIFHLAAYKERRADISHFVNAIEVNLIGSLNVFAAATNLKNLRALIVVGTVEKYGDNVPPFVEDMREKAAGAYSFSKTCQTHLAEVLFKLYDLPIVTLRPTIAYGPGQAPDMFLPSLINSLINDNYFPMTAGEQSRDFIYITDLVDLMVCVGDNCEKIKGRIFNVGSGEVIKIAELAHIVSGILGKNGLLGLGDLDYRKNEIMNYSISNARIIDQVSWSPKVTLTEGLQNTINFYKTAVDER